MNASNWEKRIRLLIVNHPFYLAVDIIAEQTESVNRFSAENIGRRNANRQIIRTGRSCKAPSSAVARLHVEPIGAIFLRSINDQDHRRYFGKPASKMRPFNSARYELPAA